MSIIQDIFTKNENEFVSTNKLSNNKRTALYHIIACRKHLGYFDNYCPKCGTHILGACCCDDRNCPICSNRRNEIFLRNEKSKLLNVNYYHITFTIPSILNDLIFHNQYILYNILFESAITSLKVVLKDPNYMGACKIGATAILHTWGSNMMYHPHLHVCLAGVGLNESNELVYPKNENFIFPEAVINKIYKGIFLKKLTKAIPNLNLSFDELLDSKQLLIDLNKKTWVVNIRDTLRKPEQVLNYFARYASRICISDSRVLEFNEINNTVSFSFKDYKNNSKKKVLTISALEFMRRFFLHILPSKFKKIRSFGFVSPNSNETLLLIASKLNQTLNILKLRKLPNVCKYCGNKEMSYSFIDEHTFLKLSEELANRNNFVPKENINNVRLNT